MIAHWPHGFTDAIIILLVVFINAVVGVVQEFKAEKALEGSTTNDDAKKYSEKKW